MQVRHDRIDDLFIILRFEALLSVIFITHWIPRANLDDLLTVNQGLVKPEEIPVSFGNAASVDINESLQDLNWEIFLGSALADGTPLVGSTFDSGNIGIVARKVAKKTFVDKPFLPKKTQTVFAVAILTTCSSC